MKIYLTILLVIAIVMLIDEWSYRQIFLTKLDRVIIFVGFWAYVLGIVSIWVL